MSKSKGAQRAPDATAAHAIDIAAFQRELVNGTRAMLGVEFAASDQR